MLSKHLRGVTSSISIYFFILTVNYFFNIYFAKNTNPSTFGEFSNIMNYVSLFFIFTSYNSSDFATYSHISNSYKNMGVFFYLSLINFIILFLGILLIFQFSMNYLYLAAFVALVGSLNFKYIYESLGLASRYLIICLFERLTFALSFIYIFFSLHNSLTFSIFLSYAFTFTLTSICQLFDIYYFFDGKLFLNYNFNYKYTIKHIKSGFNNFIFHCLKFLFGGGSKFFIYYFVGAYASGIFSSIWIFINLYAAYSSLALSYFRPILIKLYLSNKLKFRQQSTLFFALLITPAFFYFLILKYCGDYLMDNMFGFNFNDAKKYLIYVPFYSLVLALDIFIVNIAVLYNKFNSLLIPLLFTSLGFILFLNYFEPNIDGIFISLILFQLFGLIWSYFSLKQAVRRT
jgi:O-antigen/teichoic acid export membrane protein